MRHPDRRPLGDDLHPQAGPWGDDGDDQVDADAAGGRDLPVPADRWREEQLTAEIEQAARSRRVPLVMGAATAGVGAGAWGAVQIADTFGGGGAVTTVGTTVLLGSAVAVPTLRAVLRDRIPEQWARSWWLSTSCAAAWVDVVAAQGSDLLTPTVGLSAAAALILGTAALGARWADEHEVPDPFVGQDEPEPTPASTPPAALYPEVIDTSPALDVEREWDTRVAAGKTPVAPGSVLTHRTRLPYGWRWVIELDREESVGCTELVDEGVPARVALKLGMKPSHVMLERLEDDDREQFAMLTVVTTDVLAGGVDYTGPTYRDGLIRIGDYADGTGGATWRVYDNTGPLSGLVTGGQGSGKSNLFAALGQSYRWSGEWIVLFGDGDQTGGSSRALADVAHDFARGADEVLQQLEALEAMGQFRGHLMGTLTTGRDGAPTPITRPGQRPVDQIRPCRAFPGFIWFIDEFYRLANNPRLQEANFVERVEAIVRLLRKFGGAVIVGTQSALGDDFDGNSNLRGMLASGNSVTMRTKNKSEGGIVADGFSPHTLPKGGGYAFLGEGDRRAMVRTGYAEDMTPWVPAVLKNGGQPDRVSWDVYRRVRPVRELNAAVDYADRIAMVDAYAEAVETGAPLPGSAEALAAEGEDVDSDAPMSVGGFAVPTLSGNVVPIHREPIEHDEHGEQHEPQTGKPLPDGAQRVFEFLQSHPGSHRSAEIIAATRMSASGVSKALKLLAERGMAHRPAGVQGRHAAGPRECQLSDGAIK